MADLAELTEDFMTFSRRVTNGQAGVLEVSAFDAELRRLQRDDLVLNGSARLDRMATELERGVFGAVFGSAESVRYNALVYLNDTPYGNNFLSLVSLMRNLATLMREYVVTNPDGQTVSDRFDLISTTYRAVSLTEPGTDPLERIAQNLYALAGLPLSVELRTLLQVAASRSAAVMTITVFSNRDWLRTVGAPVALSVACDELRDETDYKINRMRIGTGWARHALAQL